MLSLSLSAQATNQGTLLCDRLNTVKFGAVENFYRFIRLSGGVLAIGIVFYALPYFIPGMPTAFYYQREIYLERWMWVYAHIAGGSVALGLTPFQLWARVRERHPRYHRLAGRAIALAVVVSALAGLGLATTAYGGTSNRWGFGALSIAWLVTTAVAVVAARNRRFTQHREWMVRSAALTMAAVTLRLWMGTLSPIIGFEATYAMLGWLCWVPNLVVAEWWIRTRRTKPALASRDHDHVVARIGGP